MRSTVVASLLALLFLGGTALYADIASTRTKLPGTMLKVHPAHPNTDGAVPLPESSALTLVSAGLLGLATVHVLSGRKRR
jgi:hypothetical protein